MTHINITYNNITCTTGKDLLKDSRLSMCLESKYGLIGPNGSEKSSLLKNLLNYDDSKKLY